MTTGNVPSKFLLKEIYTRLYSHPNGLTEKEVMQKQMTFGKNILPQRKKDWIGMIIRQFTSPLVIILIAAVMVSLLIPFLHNGRIEGHDWIEPIAILIILLFNGALGFYQEFKAEKTLESLKTLQPDESIVIRGGETKKVTADNLVVGDIILLSEGEKIPADIRLLESVEAKVDESVLTGESVHVYKAVDGSGDGDISEIKNMVFSGSQLLSGRIKGIVSAIGKETEIGKIAHLLSEITSPKTPLENKLEILGKGIGIGVMVISGFIFLLAFFQDFPFIDALLTSIALAVGAVPEGLPTVMTISLAIGVSVMAKKNMLVRDLKSVETLGSVTVIASDKTGTITQNNMSVVEVYLHAEKTLYSREDFDKIKGGLFFKAINNCNDAQLPNIGDPTEIGLLKLAKEKNAPSYKRISEVPFSSQTKWMSTTHKIEYGAGKKGGKGKMVEVEFIKGAPEVVANFCKPADRQTILDTCEEMAKKGIRTIAVAIKESGSASDKKNTPAIFLGIAGLQDPPREGVKKAISDSHNAGIRTIMITGDHSITAKAIGEKVGIYGPVMQGFEIEKSSNEELKAIVQNVSIYARVSPEHKVRICKALQECGEIVAMTGDGVNDAPAISQAHVGISMGKVGTAVARSASDMILIDDDFSSIVRGVREGRRIFANIKKSITFLLSTNFAEVLVLFLAIVLSLPIPLLPLHILIINLLTDSFPALALANESAENDVMKHQPRPINEGFFHGSLIKIIVLGVCISAFTLSFFAYSVLQENSLLSSQTLAFVTLSFAELFVIFSLRTEKSIFSKEYYEDINIWVLVSSIGAILITFLFLFSPLHILLSLESFHPLYFIAICVGLIVTVVCSEEIKHFLKQDFPILKKIQNVTKY